VNRLRDGYYRQTPVVQDGVLVGMIIPLRFRETSFVGKSYVIPFPQRERRYASAYSCARPSSPHMGTGGLALVQLRMVARQSEPGQVYRQSNGSVLYILHPVAPNSN
jgi:hypothetical protein